MSSSRPPPSPSRPPSGPLSFRPPSSESTRSPNCLAHNITQTVIGVDIQCRGQRDRLLQINFQQPNRRFCRYWATNSSPCRHGDAFLLEHGRHGVPDFPQEASTAAASSSPRVSSISRRFVGSFPATAIHRALGIHDNRHVTCSGQCSTSVNYQHPLGTPRSSPQQENNSHYSY